MSRKYLRLIFVTVLAGALVGPVMGRGAWPWMRDAAQWSDNDAEQVIGNSPWAQPGTASFDSGEPPPEIQVPLPGAAQAGMSGPKGPTDGKWDGGVSPIPKGGTPTLPVTIRWDSALPVRQAEERLGNSNPAGAPYTTADVQKSFIVTVTGLVPAKRYRSAGDLPTKSGSDGDTAVDPQDPEPMLEGLMAMSRLEPRGGAAIRPEDVKLDARTGTLHFFFPRGEGIDLKTKEVTFRTRFGSMFILKQFRLKEMVYKGKLEL